MDTQSEAGVLKREHLYDLVWAEPVRTVAKRPRPTRTSRSWAAKRQCS